MNQLKGYIKKKIQDGKIDLLIPKISNINLINLEKVPEVAVVILKIREKNYKD